MRKHTWISGESIIPDFMKTEIIMAQIIFYITAILLFTFDKILEKLKRKR